MGGLGQGGCEDIVPDGEHGRAVQPFVVSELRGLQGACPAVAFASHQRLRVGQPEGLGLRKFCGRAKPGEADLVIRRQ